MSGLPGLPQLHGAPALPLTGGFLLAPAQGHGPRAFVARKIFGFAWSGQAGLQHQGFLTSSKASGLCGQGIIVLPNDVHLLALLLGRATAQCIKTSAVIPIRATRAPSHAWSRSWSIARTPGRSCGRVGAVGSFARTTRCFPARASGWSPGTITRGWATAWLLQLHELAGGHRLAHPARTTGSAGTTTLPALGRVGFAPDRLTDQLE